MRQNDPVQIALNFVKIAIIAIVGFIIIKALMAVI